MYEIVIVKACMYRKDAGVMKSILDWKDDLWWFDGHQASLEEAVWLTGKKFSYGLGMETTYEAVMLCDAIRFQFEFCPNPYAHHFDVSALHDECVYAHESLLHFGDDLPKFAAIANRKLTGNEWESEVRFYALYEVEFDEYRDNDGHLDEINVYSEFKGEIDLAKLLMALVTDGK